MAPKIPSALVVVPPTKGQKMALAHNRMAITEKLMDLSEGGEKFAVALMNLIRDADNDKVKLAAIELGLKYTYGNPVNTTVQVDMSAPTESAPAGVKGLTTEQLQALASRKVEAPTDGELVEPATDATVEPDP